jgi:hypothetical protein
VTRAGFRSRTETAIVAAAAGSLALSFALTPDTCLHAPVVCPLRLVTGLPCPGCGLARSFVALAHQDPAASLAWHPFGPLAFAACAALVAIAAAERIAGGVLVSDVLLRRLRVPGSAVLIAWLGWAAWRFLAAFAAA